MAEFSQGHYHCFPRVVLGGGNFFSQEILKKMAIRLNRKSSSKYNELTDREFEVLLNVCKGMGNQEIADKMFISPKRDFPLSK